MAHEVCEATPKYNGGLKVPKLSPGNHRPSDPPMAYPPKSSESRWRSKLHSPWNEETNPLHSKSWQPEVVEGVGFEPTIPFGMPVFKTGAFNRSATPPDACASIAGHRCDEPQSGLTPIVVQSQVISNGRGGRSRPIPLQHRPARRPCTTAKPPPALPPTPPVALGTPRPKQTPKPLPGRPTSPSPHAWLPLSDCGDLVLLRI